MTGQTRGSAWILFGGTFDPPHLGHVAVVRGLLEQPAQGVILVPSGIPPHRPAPEASAEERVEMLRLATQPLAGPRLRVSAVEVELRAKGYTVDTVRRLGAELPGRDLWLALGSDVAASLGRWRQPETLLGLVKLVVFDRPGSRWSAAGAVDRLRAQGLPVEVAATIALEAPEVEASLVRRRLRRGDRCRDVLSPEVSDYIVERSLYGFGSSPARLAAGA